MVGGRGEEKGEEGRKGRRGGKETKKLIGKENGWKGSEDTW